MDKQQFARARRVVVLALASLFATAVQAEPLVAIRADNTLAFFDSTSPSAITSTKPIVGLLAGETIIGADLRPAGQTLFVVTSNARVAELDANTGTLGIRGSFGAPVTGVFGVDFNPTVDRIRVVNDADQNFRLNPDSGAIAGTDTALTPSGDTVAAAYDRNTAGATVTTLFVIDSTSNQLLRQGGADGNPSPNGGVLTSIGALGVDPVGDVSFEITSGGTAYAAMNVGGATGLYTVNLTSGAATSLGNIGTGQVGVIGLAQAPALGFAIPALSRAGLAWLVLGVLATVLLSLGLSRKAD
jgi:hypothetical protein